MAAKHGSSGKPGSVGQRVRKYGDKVVKPCWYNGRAIGHGAYFAAMVENELILDGAGKPYQFREVGTMELA